MSKWTKFRIIFNCFNTEEEIQDILGDPLPNNEVSDDQWQKALDKCHLAIGSEGSLQYSTFKFGSHQRVVVIIGTLRDYTEDQGIKWFNETIIKFKHPQTEVMIIEQD